MRGAGETFPLVSTKRSKYSRVHLENETWHCSSLYFTGAPFSSWYLAKCVLSITKWRRGKHSMTWNNDLFPLFSVVHVHTYGKINTISQLQQHQQQKKNWIMNQQITFWFDNMSVYTLPLVTGCGCCLCKVAKITHCTHNIQYQSRNSGISN